MKAVIQGKSDIVRTLQDYYINDYTRNNIGANALDLAIMRGDEKMKVILREKLFTLQDEILALEYCGARDLSCTINLKWERIFGKSLLIYAENPLQMWSPKKS